MEAKEHEVERPVLRYYGGKWLLAPWILDHFPHHRAYVEPFGGSAAVLLQKPPVKLEVYNDIDRNVVTFFQVLREQPRELIRAIELTPWSRREYVDALSVEPESDLERARQFWIMTWMSTNGATDPDKRGAWRTLHDPDGRYSVPASDGMGVRKTLKRTAARLQHVHIEEQDFHDVMRKYDGDETLFYVDPPYVGEGRSAKERYAYEMTWEGHRAMAHTLDDVMGHVVLSGYPNDCYAMTLEKWGWSRRNKATHANSGATKIESIWIKPKTWDAIQNGSRRGGLFAS